MSEPRIRLHLEHATVLRDHLFGKPASARPLDAARFALDRAVSAHDVCRARAKAKLPALPFAKPEASDRKAARERRDRERWEETKRIRAECLKRAAGKCECGCGMPLQDEHDEETSFDTPELDHFFGRGKVKQDVRNCWILATSCHYQKTNNRPTRAGWLARFKALCDRQGYVQESRRCADALAFEHAKHGALGQAEVSRGR